MTGFDSVTLNAGLMKPWKGFTPIADEEIWEGKKAFSIDPFGGAKPRFLRRGKDALPFDLLMALREIEGLRVNPCLPADRPSPSALLGAWSSSKGKPVPPAGESKG